MRRDARPHLVRPSGGSRFETMTKPLPFTAASLARAIKGAELAGKHVIGVRPDGTLILGDKPVDTASLVPQTGNNTLASKWEDQRA